MFTDALEEFRIDWEVAGKAASSVDCYVRRLLEFADVASHPTLADARGWVSSHPLPSMRRKRAQAIRAFGRWSDRVGDNDFPWWRNVPIPTEVETPQPTASAADFSNAIKVLVTSRDRALVGLLWGCGLRRSEVSRLERSDLNIADRVVVIRKTKSGHPRIVPLPPPSARLLRQHLRNWPHESVFNLSPNGITLLLRRHGLPPAHAWRRGWAVESLRSGVSETSIRAAAGWASGAMVARYTRTRAAELALYEFERAWAPSKNSRV